MLAANSAQRAVSPWKPAPAIRPPRDAFARANLRREVRSGHRPRCGVLLEREWCEPPQHSGDAPSPHILVRRWKDEAPGARQHSRIADTRFAVVAIALRATIARLEVDGRCVHDGKVPAGMAVLVRAGLSSRVEFSGACDIVHLFVPRERLFEIFNETADEGAGQPTKPVWLELADPVIERLAWLLLKADDHEGCSSEVYLDGIAAAIVARLLNASRAKDSSTARSGLVKWRLKRVQDLIEAQLSERLSLRDLATCAGLSRMHFAAQFRAATGMRPHEYLIRRRIQHAQEMLLATSMPLVEVALSVGFQTQAHFTTVFRRLLGETPARWRQAHRFG